MSAEIEFHPLSTTSHLDVSRIYLGDQEVGQERVYFGKPFRFERGQLTRNNPKFMYLRWDLAQEYEDRGRVVDAEKHWTITPEECESGIGFVVPYWTTIPGFEKSLETYPFNTKSKPNKQCTKNKSTQPIS